MSKAARALLKKINDKKNAIRGLQGQGKTQEMKDQMAELREMQEEFDMLMEMEEDDDDGIKDSLHNGKVKEIEDGQKSKKYSKAQVCKAFVNRIVCGLRKRAMPEEDQEIIGESDHVQRKCITRTWNAVSRTCKSRRIFRSIHESTGIDYITSGDCSGSDCSNYSSHYSFMEYE